MSVHVVCTSYNGYSHVFVFARKTPVPFTSMNRMPSAMGSTSDPQAKQCRMLLCVLHDAPVNSLECRSLCFQREGASDG